MGDDPTPAASAADAGTDGSASAGVCDRYCTSVIKSCGVILRQYRDDKECHEACALMTPGSEGDKNVDTVQCRIAQAAIATNKDQCVAAGPFGGGLCGARCDAFCNLVQGNCASQGANAPYASKADCTEACLKFRFEPTAGEGPDPVLEEDTLNCREFHFMLSLNDKVNHCPHTGVVSAVCKVRDAGTD